MSTTTQANAATLNALAAKHSLPVLELLARADAASDDLLKAIDGFNAKEAEQTAANDAARDLADQHGVNLANIWSSEAERHIEPGALAELRAASQRKSAAMDAFSKGRRNIERLAIDCLDHPRVRRVVAEELATIGEDVAKHLALARTAYEKSTRLRREANLNKQLALFLRVNSTNNPRLDVVLDEAGLSQVTSSLLLNGTRLLAATEGAAHA